MQNSRYPLAVSCERCGKKDIFFMQTLIDTAKDSNAEQKMFRGDYFTYQCPRCGHTQLYSFTCLYHDSKKKLLVGLADNEKDMEEMRLSLGGFYHRDELDTALNEWLKTCTVRIVDTPEKMQEKVLIAHFDLDDRIVELARRQVRMELEEVESESFDLFFNSSEDGYGFTVLTKEGAERFVPVTENMYQNILEQYSSRLETVVEKEIDAFWSEQFAG